MSDHSPLFAMDYRTSACVKAVFFALITSLGLLPQAAAQPVSFQRLGDLTGGEFDSKAFATSADGRVVVGLATASSGEQGFRWTVEGGLVSLDDLSGGEIVSRANSVSGDGAVVVGQSQSSNGVEAFRWTEDDGMVGLGDLPGGFFFSRALSVSLDGTVIVGESNAGNGFEAFRWEDGEMVGLGDLSGGPFFSQAYTVSGDGSVIAGVSQSARGSEAFRWTEEEGMVALGDLPGGKFFSVIYSASADGEVLAGWGQSPAGIEALRWTEERGLEGLGDLPGSFFFSVALSISSDGSAVVGYSETDPQGYEAFLWTEEDGMQNIKDLLETEHGLDLAGWKLSLAYDISEDGSTIVGYGRNPSGQTEAWRVSGLQVGAVSNEKSMDASALTLDSYPNPARDLVRFSIALPEPQTIALEVYDVLGRRVATVRRLAEGGESTIELSASSWPPGTYLVRLQAGEHRIRRTLTVVR